MEEPRIDRLLRLGASEGHVAGWITYRPSLEHHSISDLERLLVLIERDLQLAAEESRRRRYSGKIAFEPSLKLWRRRVSQQLEQRLKQLAECSPS